MYLMEHSGEGDRLETKTVRGFVESNLHVAGLKPGMRCIDIGCGSGAVTRVMAALTGAHAVGVDSSAERIGFAKDLAQHSAGNIEFVLASAEALPYDANSFDFSWSRFFFEYQSTLLPALKEMVRVTKPGGIIAVADLDGQMTGFYPQPEHIKTLLQHALRVLGQVGFDAEVGRKMYAAFRQQKLTKVRVEIVPYQTYYGGLPLDALKNWQAKFAQAKQLLMCLDPGNDWERAADEMLELLQREDSLYYSTLIITIGRKA